MNFVKCRRTLRDNSRDNITHRSQLCAKQIPCDVFAAERRVPESSGQRLFSSTNGCMSSNIWQCVLWPGDDEESETERGADNRAKAQRTLPSDSLHDLSAEEMAKKRTLRLEVLTKMIDEYHAKHGRHHVNTLHLVSGDARGTLDHGCTGEERRPISDRPAGAEDNVMKRRTRSPADEIAHSKNAVFQTDGSAGPESDEVHDTEENMLGISLPAIECPIVPIVSSAVPSKSTVPPTTTTTTENVGHSRGTMPTIGGLLDVSATRHEGFSGHGDTPDAPVNVMCICCGGEGGRGHGRVCGHKFHRCGLCRVQHVKRILYGVTRGVRSRSVF